VPTEKKRKESSKEEGEEKAGEEKPVEEQQVLQSEEKEQPVEEVGASHDTEGVMEVEQEVPIANEIVEAKED
jgi:hypothetical protein